MVDQTDKLTKTTKISKTALESFYELRRILYAIDHNEKQDVGNRMRADKRNINIETGVKICEKWINDNPPID